MMYEKDIRNLISSWEKRLKEGNTPQYNDALFDCIYELKQTVDKSFQEEIDYHEALEEIYADNYLSSTEAHEQPFI